MEEKKYNEDGVYELITYHQEEFEKIVQEKNNKEKSEKKKKISNKKTSFEKTKQLEHLRQIYNVKLKLVENLKEDILKKQIERQKLTKEIIEKNVEIEEFCNKAFEYEISLNNISKENNIENENINKIMDNNITENSYFLEKIKELQNKIEEYDNKINEKLQIKVQLENNHANNLLKLEKSKENFDENEKTIEKLQKEKFNINKMYQDFKEYINDHIDYRKTLNNEYQELKGNIRVYCRIRPFLKSEEISNENEKEIIDVLENNCLKLHVPASYLKSENNIKEHSFYFETIFGQNSKQSEVFSELQPFIQNALDGYNVCIFAYGQTGSGKTFTMEGNDIIENKEQKGCIEFIFEQTQYLKNFGWEYKISVSFQEIYLESVIDLLNEENNEVQEVEVSQSFDVYPLLKKASEHRKVAETKCNEHSSRSHSIFMLKLKGENKSKNSQLNGAVVLIDLAGYFIIYRLFT